MVRQTLLFNLALGRMGGRTRATGLSAKKRKEIAKRLRFSVGQKSKIANPLVASERNGGPLFWDWAHFGWRSLFKNRVVV
jgi:hypothetical protein